MRLLLVLPFECLSEWVARWLICLESCARGSTYSINAEKAAKRREENGKNGREPKGVGKWGGGNLGDRHVPGGAGLEEGKCLHDALHHCSKHPRFLRIGMKTYLPTKQSANISNTVLMETENISQTWRHFVYLLHVHENDETTRTSWLRILLINSINPIEGTYFWLRSCVDVPSLFHMVCSQNAPLSCFSS